MATNADDLLQDDPDDVIVPAGENDDEAGGEDRADDVEDAPEDDAEDADVITFGEGSIAGEDESEGMRSLRTRLREVERENRQLKTGRAPEVEEIGQEPSMDDFWDDEPGYRAAIRAYDERKARIEKAQKDQADLTQAVEREITEAATSYEAQRSTLRVANFDGAHDRVVERLGESGANILRLVAGEKAAALTYALGNSADRLDALGKYNLGKLTDVVRLAADIGRMAGETKVERKKPVTQPETVHGGGSPGRGKDTRLAQLEAKAAQTNDRTELIAYKRKLRLGGK